MPEPTGSTPAAGVAGAAPAAGSSDAQKPAVDAQKPAVDPSLAGGAGEGGSDDAAAKAAAEKAAADKKAADDKAAYDAMTPEQKAAYDAAHKVPETYADFKLPEGVVLDKAVATEFTTLAKSLNLTQEAAQKLVDFQSSLVVKQAKTLTDDFNRMVQTWKKDTLEHLGADSEKKLAVVAKAMRQFGSPELRALLNETGVGNHRAFVEFFVKVGDAISEDGLVDGKFSKDMKKTDGQLFYPSMEEKK